MANVARIAVTIYVLFSSSIVGARMMSAFDKRRVQELVHSAMRCRNIPGLSLVVVDADSVLYSRGFGFADIETNKEVDSKTLFPIASLTKAFTATLLAIVLQEANKTWDTPIRDILGQNFELYNDILTQQTTVRDLLSHRTGVPGYFLSLMSGIPSNITREQLVSRLRFHKPRYEIRTRFIYNNFMYMLAGHVAERLKGNSWEYMIRQRIFKPLAMTSSKFVLDVSADDPMASPYTYHARRLQKVDKVVLHQVDLVGPAGSIVSNADDMARWLQFHLRKGKSASGVQLVHRDALMETYQEQVASPLPMSKRNLLRSEYPVSDVHVAYDLGWLTNIYRGYRRLWHSGGVGTYKSHAWLYPNAQFGIFVSINGPSNGDTTWAVILVLQFISDILLGEKPWLNATTACSFPEPWRHVVPAYKLARRDDTPERPLADYVGTYQHPGFGMVSIALRNHSKHLHLKMGRFLEAALLYNSTADLFYTKPEGKYWYNSYRIPVRFVHSTPRGAIDTLRLPLSSLHCLSESVPFTRNGKESQKYRVPCSQSAVCVSSASDSVLTHRVAFVLVIVNIAMWF